MYFWNLFKAFGGCAAAHAGHTRDINTVQGREFEKLSDPEKEEIIEQLHQKWTNPDNEVVKRMAKFKEKSPNILKVIMES